MSIKDEFIEGVKSTVNPSKMKPLVGLVPAAALGAYLGGALSGRIADSLQAQPDNPNIINALLPDPFGLIIGFIAFFLILWLQRRAALGEAFKSSYLSLKGLLEKKGLPIPAASKGRIGLFQYEEESGLLAEKFVAQVWAERKEMEKYKGALSKYADSSLAKDLGHESHFSQVQTKKINMAVLFTDIRGFTKMSEALKTEEVVSILNDYFALAAEVVHRNSGRINKFIGDAVMAVFEDPPPYRSGATATKNAVLAGSELVASFRMKARVWKEKIETPFEADLGAGINYGSLIFGNMGSPERMEYTAIGDTVNFASRLCSASKGGQVRISEDVFKLVDGYFEMSEEDPIAVKGKAGTFKTWLVGAKKPGA